MKVILQLDLNDRIGSRCDEAAVNCARNIKSHISEERARQNMTDEQYEKWEEHVYVANMLALDSFRLAVADGTFKPDDIVVLYNNKDDEPRKWSINQYGVLIDEHGMPDPLPDLHAELSAKILTLAAKRWKLSNSTKARAPGSVAIPKRERVKKSAGPAKFKGKTQ